MVLDGPELEGAIGQSGKYGVDIDATGIFKIEASSSTEGIKSGVYVEGDVLILLKMLALKTESQVDDKLVAMVASALGRSI